MPPENAFTKNVSLTFAWYHNRSSLSCSNVSGITFTGRRKSEIVINSAVYHSAAGIYEARVSNLAFEMMNLNGASEMMSLDSASETMNVNGSDDVAVIADVPRYQCSGIVLQSLEKYAALSPVTFRVSESGKLKTCTIRIICLVL